MKFVLSYTGDERFAPQTGTPSTSSYISAKDGDFTSETINKLIKDGYESTWRKFPQFMLQHQQQKD